MSQYGLVGKAPIDRGRPTIGRIVHYVSRGSADGVFEPECRAAIIAAVDINEMVDLVVCNPNGLYFNRAMHDEADKKGGTWHWPELVDHRAEPTVTA
jgi:hypothetical protein